MREHRSIGPTAQPQSAPISVLAPRAFAPRQAHSPIQRAALANRPEAHSLAAVAMPVRAATGAVLQLEEDKAKRAETDARMDQLVEQTLGILGFLKQQGEDWEQLYSDKGKQQAKKKTKDFLDGKKTDYKAELRREILKRYWASLTLEEKLEMVSEAASVVSQGVSLFANAGIEAPSLPSLSSPSLSLPSSSSKSRPKRSKKKSRKRDEESDSGPSINWLNELTMNDLETLYDVYKVKRDVESKIEEFKQRVVEEAGGIGGSIGGAVGKVRAEVEFVKKCDERRQEFVVARKRYEFLNAAVRANKDVSRYEAEMDALHYALFSLLGPAMVYILGGLNTKGREEYPQMCADARQYLSESRTGRKLRTTGESIFRGITTLGGLLGPSREDKAQELSGAKTSLAGTLSTVANKSWSSQTGSIFVWTPKGVKKIQKALPKGKTPQEKLTRAQVLAQEAQGKKSKDRAPMTQIFYDAVADIDLEDPVSLRVSKSVLEEVGSKLG